MDKKLNSKKILIIYPHFPPSNLAGVHRARLFAMHLPAFGWEPVVLTVDEKYYEEALDWSLHKLLPADLRIEKVNAYPVFKPRLIGDIGLRAFFSLRKKALEILRKEHFDFIYIPIPSFYIALLGPYLFRKTGVPYGIDYIDPWVHHFPGSDRFFSRHWWSTKIAGWLEPLAVKNARLITGVAAGYYQGVIDRNPQIVKHCHFAAMPYGGEKKDHLALKGLNIQPYLFKKNDKKQLVYAGAMLPKAYQPLESIFQSIQQNPDLYQDLELHFIGTGKTTNDPEGFNIKPLAEKYGIWKKIVFEYPMRIPYLDVLIHLNAADGVFILGSTEPHYTPSKSYQAVLSGKLILAVLHQKSTAVNILLKANAGPVLAFDGELGLGKIYTEFHEYWNQWNIAFSNHQAEKINLDVFHEYSAFAVTQQLANSLDKCLQQEK
jgi:hypothetical protein